MKTKLLILCLLLISLTAQAQWHVFEKLQIPLRDSIVNNADYILVGVLKGEQYFYDSTSNERYVGGLFDVKQIIRGSKQIKLGTIQIILGKADVFVPDYYSPIPDMVVRVSKKWTMLFCDSAEFTTFFPKAANPLKLKVCHGEASIHIINGGKPPLAGLRGMYFRNRAALFFWLTMKYRNIHFSQDDYYTKPSRKEKRAVKEKEKILKKKKAEQDALMEKKQKENWERQERQMMEKWRIMEERKKVSGLLPITYKTTENLQTKASHED